MCPICHGYGILRYRVPFDSGINEMLCGCGADPQRTPEQNEPRGIVLAALSIDLSRFDPPETNFPGIGK